MFESVVWTVPVPVPLLLIERVLFVTVAGRSATTKVTRPDAAAARSGRGVALGPGGSVRVAVAAAVVEVAVAEATAVDVAVAVAATVPVALGDAVAEDVADGEAVATAVEVR